MHELHQRSQAQLMGLMYQWSAALVWWSEKLVASQHLLGPFDYDRFCPL